MEVSVGHASTSSGLLGMEASLAKVFLSGLKTGGGVTMGGARGTIDVMGCVRPCYPCFVIFFLLGPRGIVVI
jgi:hypothetical protein